MTEPRETTIPEELRPYVREVVDRLTEQLGGELLGVYATGSVALGAYVAPRSDVDLAAVSRHELPNERKHALASALRHESLPCPARGLELVVYAEQAVRVPTRDAAFELNLNSGREMPFHLDTETAGVDCHWFVIDRAILRVHGIGCYGPGAETLFAEIPEAIALDALMSSLRWHRAGAGAGSEDSVLNACRAVRYAATGEWSSKPDAGRWAIGRLGDDQLVRGALAACSSGRPLESARIDAFVVRAAGELDTAGSAVV